jgi:hypothetical protein
MKHVTGLLVLVTLTACTDQQIYEAVQNNQQLECQQYPDTRYEECMRQSGTPYKDYKKTLDDR